MGFQGLTSCRSLQLLDLAALHHLQHVHAEMHIHENMYPTTVMDSMVASVAC